jgi:hypothetical protein
MHGEHFEGLLVPYITIGDAHVVGEGAGLRAATGSGTLPTVDENGTDKSD